MDFNKLTHPKDFPKEFNSVIEIPQNSFAKYEFDEVSNSIFLKHFAYGSMAYPFNYGFIPKTISGDGDALDVLVISSYSVYPLTVIPSRAIGMFETEDQNGIDNKIIAVPLRHIDPFYAEVSDIQDLGSATRGKIRNFFDRHKELEPNKWVKVKNLHGKDIALKEIKKSVK